MVGENGRVASAFVSHGSFNPLLKLRQAYERRHHMETSLDEAETLAQRLNREKDKWLWQYEKSEKVS